MLCASCCTGSDWVCCVLVAVLGVTGCVCSTLDVAVLGVTGCVVC